MSKTFADFAPLLDFSQWETAVQNFFCDDTQGGGLFVAPQDNATADAETWQPPKGVTAFFTGFQAQLFTKSRPRIDLGPVSHTEVQQTRIVDVNGRLWRPAWQVPLEFFVITKNDYSFHTQFLAQVRAIIHMMNPAGVDPATGRSDQSLIATSGLNPFLTTHELSKITDSGGQTFGGKWQADEGYFLTPLKYNAIFAVQINQWPGGILNA